MQSLKIIERRECLKREKYLLVNGALVRLSEFPNLAKLAPTEKVKATTADCAEGWR